MPFATADEWAECQLRYLPEGCGEETKRVARIIQSQPPQLEGVEDSGGKET